MDKYIGRLLDNRYEILEGKIYFKGQDITEAPCHERAKLGIGMMIQRPPTIRGLTLRQMITICGATPEEVDKMAQWMGLSEFLDRSVTDGCFSFCLERESPIG